MFAGIAINPAIGAGMMILQSGILLLNAYRFKMKAVPDISSNVISPSRITDKQLKIPPPTIQIEKKKLDFGDVLKFHNFKTMELKQKGQVSTLISRGIK